jgi:hypothetical protein
VQKFGRKGSGKRISKKVWNLLEGYFLEDNVNKSERYIAESMLIQLSIRWKIVQLKKKIY